MHHSLFIGNDNLIRLENLTDKSSGAFLAAAAVLATLRDVNGAEITGETWPLAMDYVAGSDGCYEGVMSDGAAIEAGCKYELEMTADDGPGRRAQWITVVTAIQRRG